MEDKINNNTTMDDIGEVSWNSQLERIICEEGERCLCFSWLHSKSEKKFSSLNIYISIPVIIMSTIAGSASIGAQSLFQGAQIANFFIGGISLSVGVLNTIASFFAWAKRTESHRISAVNYQKIYRFILIELALPRGERMAAKDMLKVVRDQCDRLQETSPQIPETVLREFKLKFGDSTPDVKKPEITNGLDPILVYSLETATPLAYKTMPPPTSIRVVSPTQQEVKNP
jgi:hypothetical protein